MTEAQELFTSIVTQADLKAFFLDAKMIAVMALALIAATASIVNSWRRMYLGNLVVTWRRETLTQDPEKPYFHELDTEFSAQLLEILNGDKHLLKRVMKAAKKALRAAKRSEEGVRPLFPYLSSEDYLTVSACIFNGYSTKGKGMKQAKMRKAVGASSDAKPFGCIFVERGRISTLRLFLAYDETLKPFLSDCDPKRRTFEFGHHEQSVRTMAYFASLALGNGPEADTRRNSALCARFKQEG